MIFAKQPNGEWLVLRKRQDPKWRQTGNIIIDVTLPRTNQKNNPLRKDQNTITTEDLQQYLELAKKQCLLSTQQINIALNKIKRTENEASTNQTIQANKDSK